MRRLVKFLIPLGVLVVVGLTAVAVAPTPPRVTCDRVASPDGPGSVDRLVRTMRSGQVACLREGRYVSGSELTLDQPGITLRSFPGERASVRARLVISAPRVTLESLVLDGTKGTHSLPSPTINAPDVVVRDNDITNRTGICVHPSEHRGTRPDRFVVERNRIHHCGRRPPTNHDHGIYAAAGRGGLVRHNVVYGNADRGIQLYPEARGTRVERNTLDGNGEGLHFGGESADNIADGNVITNSRVRWNLSSFELSGRGNAARSTCLSADRERPAYVARGGIEPDLEQDVALGPYTVADPLYADPSAGAFQLKPGSPCQGQGAPPEVGKP